MTVGYSIHVDKITHELTRTLKRIDTEKIDALVEAINSSKKIFVAGAGRSGFMMRSFCMRLMHLGFEAYVVGETITPNISDQDLLIIGSGSGSTSALVSMAEKAHLIGAAVSLVTVTPDSPAGLLADPVIYIPAISPKVSNSNNPVSIQPMGSLFEQSLLILLDTVIVILMDTMDKNSEAMFARHANLE